VKKGWKVEGLDWEWLRRRRDQYRRGNLIWCILFSSLYMFRLSYVCFFLSLFPWLYINLLLHLEFSLPGPFPLVLVLEDFCDGMFGGLMVLVVVQGNEEGKKER
jgi:hypothetical protein